MRINFFARMLTVMTVCICYFSTQANSQTIVTGRVNSSTGEALTGVSVVVKGSSSGTTADAQGNFRIQVPDINRSILVFTLVGYEDREVALTGSTTLNVVMTGNEKQLDQVIVVGYGTQKKTRVTGAVSVMGREDLTNRPVTQTSQALQGKMAGVTVTQNFGAPGSDGGTVRIRGVGTLGVADALVLIDGVPGTLNDINPADIESLSVLKDAASASIYGSRAANGVILITTKRGKKNQPLTVNYNGLVAMQQPTNLLDLVDGATFMMLRNEETNNNNAAPPYSADVINNYKQKVGTEPYFNTNWFDKVITKNALQHSHTLTIRGGGEKTASMVSLAYMGQDGLTDNTQFKRLSVRFNNNFQATKKLSFALDGFLRKEVTETPNGLGNGINQLFRMMYEIPNIYPAVWQSGAYGEGWNGDNPYAYIHGGGRLDSLSSRLQLNLRATYNIFDWLSAEVAYAPKFVSGNSDASVKTYTFKRIDNSTGLKPTPNSLRKSNSRMTEDFYQAILRFNKTFGKHSVAAMAGMESIVNKQDSSAAYRSNFTLQDYMVINSGDPATRDNWGYETEWELFSNFGQIVYGFDNKYLFEAKLRRDGSSRFSKENRWGWFPSFSAGWVMSEERFLQNVTYVNHLKLRGSWGQLGNQDLNTGNYPYLSLVSLNQPYYFNNNAVTGSAQTVMANDDITWETATTLNLGVDFGLFSNRLTGSFDIYRKNTRDILYPINISATMGLRAAPQNIAEVENTGWDLLLSWDDKLGGIRYGADLVMSDVRNKVVDVKARPRLALNSIIEGQEFQAFYGYEAIGIYRTAEDLAANPPINANVKLGDLIYKDQNKDGKIDAANDKKVIGSNIPRYTYGLTLKAGYGGFDLSVFLQGVGKKSLYFIAFNPGYGGNYSTYQLDNRYVPDDPSTHQTASIPRLLPGSSVNTEESSFYLYNAAYLRFKNIMLAYTLPKAVLDRLKVNNIRFYVTGTNLFSIDRLPINTIDPESPTTLTGPAFYPNIKTYSMGIDINF